MLLCVDAERSPACETRWEEMLDALDAVSPLVDDVRPGLAFVEMRGIAGDPARWMQSTRAALEPFHLPVRLGVAGNKIAARAAAFIADGTVCAERNERKLLAPLPLAFLELEPEIIERLRLLGIDSLGDLARLPRGPFVRRFGTEAAQWHALARGIDMTMFTPRGHAVAIEATMFGEGSVNDEMQVIFALRLLLTQICTDLDRCGKRAGALRLDVELEDAHACSFDVPLAFPTAQERAMLDVLRAKLESATFPAAIVGLRLRAQRLEEGGEATELFTGDELDPQTIAVTLARLEATIGEPVRQAATRSAHALEERFTYATCNVLPQQALRDVPAAAFREELVPQLRLLAVAEIDVQLRDGVPAFVGNPPQAVIECAGPWRVEDRREHPPLSRDEYDVSLENGKLCRIYHQGPHWYLRGAYD
jgi:nucleotidyltransferase/DNA polymerase involved in DNA repair